MTKQLGNIILMSDTPNKRGQRKVLLAQNPHFSPNDVHREPGMRTRARTGTDIGVGEFPPLSVLVVAILDVKA